MHVDLKQAGFHRELGPNTDNTAIFWLSLAEQVENNYFTELSQVTYNNLKVIIAINALESKNQKLFISHRLRRSLDIGIVNNYSPKWRWLAVDSCFSIY